MKIKKKVGFRLTCMLPRLGPLPQALVQSHRLRNDDRGYQEDDGGDLTSKSNSEN